MYIFSMISLLSNCHPTISFFNLFFIFFTIFLFAFLLRGHSLDFSDKNSIVGVKKFLIAINFLTIFVYHLLLRLSKLNYSRMMSNNSANIMIEINFEVKDKIFLLSKVDGFWLKSTKNILQFSR